MAIGGSFKGGVMHQKHHIVRADLGVALKHSVAVSSAFFKGGQGIFWG
jgi:hypothetical protein